MLLWLLNGFHFKVLISKSSWFASYRKLTPTFVLHPFNSPFFAPNLRLISAKMDECLKRGGDGRKYAIALSALEYSGDLSNQLMAFSNKMEAVFKMLQDLRKRKVEDESAYTKHFAIMEDKLAWFDKAEAGVFTFQKRGSGGRLGSLRLSFCSSLISTFSFNPF